MFSGRGIRLDPKSGSLIDCLFCNIIKRTEPGTIVHECDLFSAFHTIRPYTDIHVLMCPKKHIQSCSVLSTENDAKLVEDMVQSSYDLMKKTFGLNKEEVLLVFHVPPFNSIDHLHLHVIGNPENMSWVGKLKYSENLFGYCKNANTVIKEIRESLSGP